MFNGCGSEETVPLEDLSLNVPCAIIGIFLSCFTTSGNQVFDLAQVYMDALSDANLSGLGTGTNVK